MTFAEEMANALKQAPPAGNNGVITLPEAAAPPEKPAEVRAPETVAPAIKGQAVQIFANESTSRTSDKLVDVRKYNRVHVDVLVTGTTPSATITVVGRLAGASFLAVPDSNGTQPAVTANKSFDCAVGMEEITVQLSSVTGTFSSGQGFTVVVTPYVGDWTGPDSTACSSADVHAPSSNTAAVVTYAAVPGARHAISGIVWSYAGGTPTNGNLKVEDVSGTTVFTMDITDQGPGFIPFPKPKKSAAVNTAMIITLAAGGSGITGKICIMNHWLEA